MEETPNADYRYRATLPADAAAECIAQAVLDINYDNFKNSIEDQQYHHTCSNVWSDMLRLQEGGKYNFNVRFSLPKAKAER